MILREYQQKAFHNILEKLQNMDIVVSTASMGAGKSIIITKLTEYLLKESKLVSIENKICIVVNLSPLVKMLYDYLTEINISCSVIKRGFDYDYDSIKKSKILIIMEQSFHERKRKSFDFSCSYLIKDEFHIGYSSPRFNKIKEFLKPKKIIGFSGTPIDERGYLLKDLTFENLVLDGNALELMELGYLSKLKYYTSSLSEQINYSSVKISQNDYSTSELDKILNNTKSFNLALTSMNALNSKNKKTLVYCNSIEHATEFTKFLNENGYRSFAVHSKIPEEENERAFKRFKLPFEDTSGIDCLVSVSKLNTGFNEPMASLLVLLRPTKVLRVYLQTVFRVARPYPGKDFAEVLDLAQCVREHGFAEEPRDFVLYGNRKELNIEKSKHSLPVIKELSEKYENQEYIFELKKEDIKINLREYKKKVNFDNMNTNNLIKSFNTNADLYMISFLYYELMHRIHKKKYEKNDYEALFKILENSNLKLEKIKEILKKQIRNNEILDFSLFY